VPMGAVLLVISGAWMAWSVLRRPSAVAVGARAQPRVQ
jgi:ABC-type nickel/cobalt efflux system permease component RcnA